MIVSLRQIPLGHSKITQSVEMSDEQVQDGHFEGPVRCSANVHRLTHEIILRVAYSCTIRQECSRCMRSFMLPLSGTCTITLVQRSEDTSASIIDDGAADGVFSTDETEFDTRQALYEEIMTSVPMMPLCTSECPGVIVDRTESETIQQGSAPSPAIDPRWAALQKLKKK